MSSPSAVVCREIFDENSQPSADEISEYAHQLGIDPESESHLLPLAREGLMQALPPPWKAYFDEKLQTHYYYNEETKSTQWEHPLDNVYRELVKRARDASVHDDTCASVQELPTSEDNTKNLERVETRVESDDDDLSTDSEQRPSENKGRMRPLAPLAPLSSIPPITPLSRKLAELKISPLRRSIDAPLSPKPLIRPSERPRTLPKQHSDVIDLKMHVLSSPEEEVFSPLLSNAKIERGLPFSGKGNMFLKLSKSDLPSPDTEKSLPDSLTKSDPPKGILREKSDISIRRNDNVLSRPKQTASFEEDRKSVRFKLENTPEPTVSPGSNSSSEQNEGQSSIISAAPLSLEPLVGRPPLPPRPIEKEIDGVDDKSREKSPRRRLLRPPASDYIKPELFQKNFQKISELVRRQDSDSAPPSPEKPVPDTEPRPRSPMIPQKNKISINLMESIESETSIDSPDREFANLDLNDLDESNESHDSQHREEAQETKTKEISPTKEIEESENTNSKVSEAAKPQRIDLPIPQIKVPKLDFLSKQKFTHSDSEDSKKSSNREDEISHAKTSTRSNSIDIPKDNRNLIKLSPTPSLGDRSPKFDFAKTWSTPLSTFKPLNKIGNANKSSESVIKGATSPRLDGVIISQGKTSSDNVVVVYQFETQEENFPKPIKSPLIPDMGTREFMERNKNDEKRRLELSLQKELELIRMEWSAKEKKMRAELQEEIAEAERRFLTEKRMRLNEQAERHKKEMEETLSENENRHQAALQKALADMSAEYEGEAQEAERRHKEALTRLKDLCANALAEERERLEIENERALAEVREQLQLELSSDRARMIEENRLTIDALREEHTNRVTDLRLDYRAEVERLRRQQATHIAEVRARLLGERAAAARTSAHERALPDKYKCLKEKYARLKHDVKLSIERRNKRREMSMTTGSETEKSNSHKATHSLEKCKEVNETSVSVVIEADSARLKANNNAKSNDNETSISEGNAHKSDNNNDEWKAKSNTFPSALLERGERSARTGKRPAVAFRDPPRTYHSLHAGAATDYQDSSDATTADERPKEAINGHGRRRCFTRLKSASTSRLNYSPKRGEGWGGPLEALRLQLRKLDELEEQCPDLACQPPYALPYPFADLEAVRAGGAAPELEFVRHRALVEREGMRRARAVLRRRRAALRDAHKRAPEEEREATELEVALHRARALLGEKEIRLRHIERALRALPDPRPPEPQEPWSSSASSEEEALGVGVGVGAGGAERSGAVLRSLRALHKDVRHIWRAVHAAGQSAASPETSSCNVPSTSQTKMTLSGGEPSVNDVSDGVAERARGLRAWLHTAP